VSAFRRSIPFIAGGALLAASAFATSGCSATAEAEPVAASQSTAPAAVPSSASPSPSNSPSASPSASPSVSAIPKATATPKASATKKPTATTKPTTKSSSSTLAAENAALKRQGVPCDATAVACVSLSKQEAWLLRDGKVVYGPVKVATGRASLPTPAGNFTVYYKVVDGWSNTYNAPMPYSVYFYKGDAFHEDPVTVRSHGCVHLTWTAAKYFYNFLHYGDKVEVRY
jgi:lipoprotein-anchoring transpeptidase ErfK/SrfK